MFFLIVLFIVIQQLPCQANVCEKYPGYQFFHEYVEQQLRTNGLKPLKKSKDLLYFECKFFCMNYAKKNRLSSTKQHQLVSNEFDDLVLYHENLNSQDVYHFIVDLNRSGKNITAVIQEWMDKAQDEALVSTIDQVNCPVAFKEKMHAIMQKNSTSDATLPRITSCVCDGLSDESCSFAKKVIQQSAIQGHFIIARSKTGRSYINKKMDSPTAEYTLHIVPSVHDKAVILHEIGHAHYNDEETKKRLSEMVSTSLLNRSPLSRFLESRADIAYLSSYPEHSHIFASLFRQNACKDRCCTKLFILNDLAQDKCLNKSHPLSSDRYKSVRMLQELFYQQARYEYEMYTLGFEKSWDHYCSQTTT